MAENNDKDFDAYKFYDRKMEIVLERNAKRLATAGWGQEKPIADNNTEDAKAKNRRVELVKQ